MIACRNKITRRKSFKKNRIRASIEELSGPVLQAKPQLYLPSEDISDSEEYDENGYAILRPARIQAPLFFGSLQQIIYLYVKILVFWTTFKPIGSI